jgi:hypothetical protein
MEFKGHQDVEGLSTQLKGESSRCAVIVTAAFFDEKLKTLLEERTSRSDLSTHIKNATDWSLLTQNENDDLNTLRMLRNKFAHDLKQKDFDEESAGNVAEMKTWQIASRAKDPENVITTPLDQLLFVVGTIAFRLQRRAKAQTKTGPLPEPGILDFKAWPSVSNL